MKKENKTPKLSILTVNWNGKEYLEKLVSSIQKYTKDYELIIIDNNSDKENILYIQKLAGEKDGNVRAFYLKENTGWVGGINEGLKYAEGKYICFINNDIEVTENWFENIKAHFEDPAGIRVGMVGCTTNFTMGLQKVELNKQIEGNHHQVNYLIGWLMLTKRSVLEDICEYEKRGTIKEVSINGMAGLDTRFGIGSSDDLDLSLRVKKAGYELFIAREVFVKHHGSKSFVKMFGKNLYKKGTKDNLAYMADVDKKLDILKNKWGKDTIKELLTVSIPQPERAGTIGIPHLDFVPHKFHTDLMGLKGLNNVEIMHVYGSQIPKARNDIVKDMKGEWLVFIDSDMTFPSDSVQKLIEKAKREDVDIVGAPCFRKVPSYEPCWFFKVPGEDNYYRKFEWGNEMFEVDSMGMAFCLIKKKVFEKMAEKSDLPLFQYTDELSEDLLFCQKAKELGFKIWIDPSLKIGHLIMLPIEENVYKAFNAKAIEEWKKQKEEFGEDPFLHSLNEAQNSDLKSGKDEDRQKDTKDKKTA